MSIGSVDMVEEIVPYLGLDQPYLVPFLCGGALDAPQLAARGCAAAVSLKLKIYKKYSFLYF